MCPLPYIYTHTVHPQRQPVYIHTNRCLKYKGNKKKQSAYKWHQHKAIQECCFWECFLELVLRNKFQVTKQDWKNGQHKVKGPPFMDEHPTNTYPLHLDRWCLHSRTKDLLWWGLRAILNQWVEKYKCRGCLILRLFRGMMELGSAPPPKTQGPSRN